MTATGPIGLVGLEGLYIELAEAQEQERRAARDARHEAQEQRIEALQDQADHIEEAALWSGAGQIAQGGATAAGGAVNLGISSGGTTQDLQSGEAWGSIVAGTGSAQAGILKIFEGQEQADASRAAAQAEASAGRAQDAKDIEDDARASRQTFLRRLESAQQTQHDLRNALVKA